MEMGLDGRACVVTGAANGIGRAIAEELAREGACLALADIEEEALGQLSESLGAAGIRLHAQAGDLTRSDFAADFLARAAEALGPIEVLVNNLGRSARQKASLFHLSEEATWRDVIEISLVSALRCSRIVVPGMRERRFGRIVNIASDSALVGDAGVVDYAAAKMGVIGMTRALARELAAEGITVNAVAPGLIATRAQAALGPQVIDRIRAGIPAKRAGSTDEVAGLVAFLAGTRAGYITGQTIVVDGGRWML